MCRLFGLHAGTDVCTATFWLLDAPDSLSTQSRRNPDGTGLGVFDERGRPQLRKQPMAAWEDAAFATEAHEMTGTTFLAHVRYATTGSHSAHNTHPFLQDDRLFAHNGVVKGLDAVDERLRDAGTDELVLGDTDSERVFALITASIRARNGDVRAGLLDAIRWLAANVPLYAVNVLLSTATDMWALRYPDTHELYVLDRRHDRRGRRSAFSPAHQPDSHEVRTPARAVVGGVRQRTHGRRPALAADGVGRADPRRRGIARREQRGAARPAPAPAGQVGPERARAAGPARERLNPVVWQSAWAWQPDARSCWPVAE